MEKNYTEDIVPPRKSIKDIPLSPRKNRIIRNDVTVRPTERKEVPEITQDSKTENININDINMENFSDNYGTTGNKWKLWGIGGGLLIILIVVFLILNSLHSAEIKITPKSEKVSFNNSISIEDFANSINPESLKYRTIELQSNSEKIVEANDEELVQEKASGTIRIFNEYSSEEQKLIKNTRFESEKGKIYRIQESITVPGYTKDGDKIIAGQLDAVVYADEIGEDYNTNSSTFTIPGFKGQEPYDFFKAETITAISGGFDGIRKIISTESLENAEVDLTATLTNKLIDEVSNQITDEFILVYNNQSFEFEPIKQEDILTSNQSKLKLTGKIKAKVFNKIDISNAFANANVSEYSENDNVLIKNFEDIKIDLIMDPESNNEKLQINGESELTWILEENKLKTDILNKPKSALIDVLKNHSAASKAEAVIKPFWRGAFPDKIDDIKVKIIE